MKKPMFIALLMTLLMTLLSGPAIANTANIDSQVSTAVATPVQQLKVDINNATAEELTVLPGIGKAKAAAIVHYRESKGRFTRKDQLVDVKGISVKILEKIEDKIMIQ